MLSSEGEKIELVDLISTSDAKGAVERWLLQVRPPKSNSCCVRVYDMWSTLYDETGRRDDACNRQRCDNQGKWSLPGDPKRSVGDSMARTS